jgi:hypothetical protein
VIIHWSSTEDGVNRIALLLLEGSCAGRGLQLSFVAPFVHKVFTATHQCERLPALYNTYMRPSIGVTSDLAWLILLNIGGRFCDA